MLWVCTVSLLVLSVLAGATPDQHPVFRRYPVGKQRSGALRSADSTFKDDPDCDPDEPVYFRLEQLYTEPTERDCLRCMIPRLELDDNPDLCGCLPCSFKMTPGEARLPPEIADNLFRLKCDPPCGSEEEDYDTGKYLDLIHMLMRSGKKELENPAAEAKISKKEFTPLGRRTEGGKSSRYMSHCPDGICEDVAPHQFIQGHSRKVNRASGEKVPKKDAANKRARTDTRHKPFIMNDKSRAGLGTYNMPYPRPSFHLPGATSPQEGKMEEIKFRVQTRRNESNKTHKSGEKKSRNNKNRKEKLSDGLETRRAENLREEEEEEEEEEAKNRNIALAMTAADPESILVIPDSDSPSTDSDEYVNILVKKFKKNSGKSTVMKAEEVPENETEESVDVREFDEERSAITENYLMEEEEEDSTTVEAYPTTTENTSGEEVEEFSDDTTEKATRYNSEESTEEPWETTENEYYSDNVKMLPDSYEEDDIGYRRNDETTTKKPEKTAGGGKRRARPKIVIEIADAKNSTKPGVDGVINMKVDVYSKGDLGNVYRFLSKLIPPEYRSEKVSDPVQLRFQPLMVSDSDEYA